MRDFQAEPTVEQGRLVRNRTTGPVVRNDEWIVIRKDSPELSDDVKDGDSRHLNHLGDVMKGIFARNAL